MSTLPGKCTRPRSRSALPLLLLFLAITLAADAFNHNTSASNHRAMSSSAKKQRLDDGDAPREIRAGFIGCGTIASAIATSLATPSHAGHLAQKGLALASISVTRRSESKSGKLKEEFPEVVTVCESPEEVVQNSNLVFLCVLPQHVDGVLEAARGAWTEEHTLVSLVSTSKVDDLIQKTGLLSNRVYKMICLPAIAKREGCALLQPAPSPAPTNGNKPSADDIDVKSLLDALGGCVECANDDAMNTMMVTTSMMGPMYGIMKNNREWLVKRGVSPEDASYFVGRSYLSMVQDAERGCQEPARFDDLIEEQTPGGLNEQALGNLERQGVFNAYDKAMDAVLSRLQGKSDRSLPSD